MSHTSELIRNEDEGELKRTLRFVGKFLLAVIGIIAALRIIGVAFAFSSWTGYAALAVVAIMLYATARRWVGWVPGLLLFGIINSLLALVTRHAPTNPHVEVSVGVAGLSLAFYVVGCVATYQYDATHLSVVDRCALLVYLFSLVWPALARSNSTMILTPIVVWGQSIGMVALIVSSLIHVVRRRRRGFHT
jgi:hypothetical protein